VPKIDVYDRIMAAIEAVPGVQSCTMSAMPLIARSEWDESVQPDGSGAPQRAFIQIVRWNFFRTMGIPLLAGRDLAPVDADGRPRVAVINETMARQLFGERRPLGRHFQFVDGPDRNAAIELICVASDAKYASLEQPVPPTLFMPHAQVAPREMTVEVRTTQAPMVLAATIREAVRGIDPAISIVVLAIGAGIGVALARAASQLMGSLLFGIGPSDPLAIGSALAVLVGVALIASYLPARRATHLDPTEALRYE
jgi:hypothetical protein